MTQTNEKTYIQGKDAALEDSISRLQRALSDNGFNIIEHTWSNPAPNIWWVHLRDADYPLCFTNGKGATKKAALASALGEYIERLSCNYFFADYHLGDTFSQAEFVHYPDEKWFAAGEGTLRDNCPEGLLDTHLQHYYDPDAELPLSQLSDINSGNVERGICAIPFVRQSDQTPVYIPVNIVGNLYVSNGMSAGNTVAEARTQALSEVFERYVKNKIIAEGIALPLIPDAVLADYPQVVEALNALTDEGYLMHVFDASLGGQFPVVCVTLLNREDGGCFTSFGAHPSFAVALERTVTELLQGRSLKEMDIFAPPVFDNELVADAHNLETHFIDSSGMVSWDLYRADKDYAFTEWDFSDKTDNELAFLMDCFQRLSAEVYIADYQHLGVYACRAIVAGISEIYPVEELTQYNNNIGIEMRQTITRLPLLQAIDAERMVQLLDWLDDTGLDDSELVRQVFGFAADKDSAWASLRLGELRCFLLLGLDDHEAALDMAEWVLTFGSSTMTTQRRRFFACLIEQLQLALDGLRSAEDYAWVHKALYGDDIYQAACDHVAGRANFYDLLAIDRDYVKFDAHSRLLAAYEKLQIAKERTFFNSNAAS